MVPSVKEDKAAATKCYEKIIFRESFFFFSFDSFLPVFCSTNLKNPYVKVIFCGIRSKFDVKNREFYVDFKNLPSDPGSPAPKMVKFVIAELLLNKFTLFKNFVKYILYIYI
jgi:hypothetical protein